MMVSLSRTALRFAARGFAARGLVALRLTVAGLVPLGLVGALGLASSALAQQAQPAKPTKVTFGYLSIKNDPRYDEIKTYANLVLRPAIDPFQGAQVGLRDGRIMGRALKMNFELGRVEGTDAKELLAGLDRLYTEKGVRFFLLDAPGDIVANLAKATRGRDLLLLNVTAPDDALRGAACAPQLLDVAPSLTMLTDALAEYALVEKWRNILLLRGPRPEDKTLADSYARSFTRFGAKIVDTREFVPTKDPRQREQNNIPLLTSGPDYDAVVVADTEGDFGRFFPYQVALPRPVIGSVGLVPAAWDWTLERYGAPQLNQRFEHEAKRQMTSYDWEAWAAVRVVIAGIAGSRSAELAPVEAYLKGDALRFDMYKGAPGSFRSWDNQLRQPIVLHTSDAVIAVAPFEQFLHPVTNLDSLGVDKPQTECRF
jgi:ABC transporter substrate binding protein (PQQ-dependent alcohol dehydrogenase system)